MDKTASSGTSQSTLSTSSPPNVQVEQPVQLEATSLLQPQQESVYGGAQPAPLPITSRRVTPTETATQPKPTSLGLTSQVGIWLDRNLPLIYQKAEALKQKTEKLDRKANTPQNRHHYAGEACKLYKEHIELIAEYFDHLDTYPDEPVFLKQHAQGKPCHSRSELAYERMHSAILLQLEQLYSLPRNFAFNCDIVKAFEAQLTQRSPYAFANNSVIRAIGTKTPDQMICQMLRLTECLFQCSEFTRKDHSPEEKLNLPAQYLIDTGFTLGMLRSQGISVEAQLEESRANCVRMSSFLDKVDDYMLEVALKDQSDIQHWYITGSLRFSYFLRHPSTTCRLLFHLSALSKPPPEEDLVALLTVLTDLIEKTRGVWTPFQAAVFYLQDHGWLDDKPDIPEVRIFKELLEAVKRTSAISYPPELCILQTPAPVPPEQWMPVPCPSQFRGNCKPTKARHYYSLPAINDLWSDILTLPCMSVHLPAIPKAIGQYLSTVSDSPKLKEMSNRAHRLWEQVSNVDGAQKEHQNSRPVATPWVKAAKKVIEEYESYLKTHPQERLLICGDASFNKKHNKRSHELLKAHYNLQHLSFLYHRGLFGTQFLHNDISDLCQKALIEKNSEKKAKKIDLAASFFSQLQHTYTEIIATRFLLARCYLAHKWQTKELATFVEETSQEMLDCIADFHQIILEIERIAKPDQQDQCKCLINRLKKCLAEGPLYKNIALPSKIWPAINPEIAPDWATMSFCIQLLASPEETTCTLESLDKIEGVVTCPHDLQHPLFQILTERFEALSSRITPQSPPHDVDKVYEELYAVSQSLCHGFLLKQWFDLLANCNGNLPPACDLLSLVRQHQPAIDQHFTERQKQAEQTKLALIEELEQATTPKQPAKRKTRSSFTPVTAACWEAPKSTRKARVKVISEEEQLLSAAENMIVRIPDAAIKELKKLQVRFQEQPNLQVRMFVGLAEAALMKLEPCLEKIISLDTKAEKFCLLLQIAQTTEPYKFSDTHFYGTMVKEFQKVPAICEELKALLDTTIPHISALHQKVASQQVDADIKKLVDEHCTKALATSQKAARVVIQLSLCIQQRKNLNAKRSEFLSRNPEIVKTRPKTAEDSAKPAKEVFPEAEQSLQETQNVLSRLVKITQASTSPSGASRY